MITQERQHVLFKAILASLNRAARDFIIYLTPPLLEYECIQNGPFENTEQNLGKQDALLILTNVPPGQDLPPNLNLHDDDDNENKRIIDILGYFKPTEPEKVFLCREKIIELSQRWQSKLLEKNKDGYLIYLTEADLDAYRMLKDHEAESILAEIVYIHEVAHYIHFHINSHDFIHWTESDRSFYIETFAQLVTQRMVNDVNLFSKNYVLFFDKLLMQQDNPYTLFKKCHTPVFLFPEHVVLYVFLNQVDFNAKSSIFSILETAMLEEWEKLKGKYEPDDREIIDLIEDLDDVGLANDSFRLDFFKDKEIPSWSSGACIK